MTRAALVLFALAAAAACTVTTNEPAESPGDPVDPAGPSASPGAPGPSDAPTASPSATAAPQAPPRACTMMGCVDGLHVELEGPQPKGAYEIAVEADGKRATCRVSLPLPACDKGPAVQCKGDVEVMIGEKGCALPPDQHGFGPLNFKGAAANVKVSVKRAGKEVGAGTFSPTYRTVQPNGPNCPPTCKQARDKITVK